MDLILVATATPDTVIPSTASRVQAALCTRPVAGFDISGACAGFHFALSTGATAIAAGTAGRVLVIGAEVRSRFTNPADPSTAILYGDGAGAVILERAGDTGSAILHLSAGMDGSLGHLVGIPAGGSRLPASHATVDERLHTVRLDGTALFRTGVRCLVDAIEKALAESGLSKDDIALYVPHQMNRRMLQTIAQKLDVDFGRFFVNVERYGNTSAATIPMALAEAEREGRIRRGQLACLATFGGGIAWGITILRW